MHNELAAIKRLNVIKVYAVIITALLIVLCLSGFAQSGPKQNFEEITARTINVVDSSGKIKVRLAGDLNNRSGIFFYNEGGRESGD
jgi:hypothetical protein